MAFDENGGGNGLVMPVAPMYGGGNQGNGGWGGDWGWIILLLLLAGNGGWGMGGGFGGFGGGLGYDFPWLLNGQNQITASTADGFRTAQLSDGITSIRDGIGNLSTQLCSCCSDMNMALANGFSGVEQGANARQMANMQQGFAAQTAMAQGFNAIASQLADCCCENRLASADLKYTLATEACSTRANSTANTQAILDKLCQLELDGKNDRIADLERQLTMANLAASQTRQTADIQNNIVNELRSCPIPAQPVYGSQPIFTCPNNNSGCGCGCGGNF